MPSYLGMSDKKRTVDRNGEIRKVNHSNKIEPEIEFCFSERQLIEQIYEVFAEKQICAKVSEEWTSPVKQS